jgi:hypothetical protein
MEITMVKKPAKTITPTIETADASPAITPIEYSGQADRPAYEMLPDRYDDPFRRTGGPDAGEPDWAHAPPRSPSRRARWQRSERNARWRDRQRRAVVVMNLDVALLLR